jgi:hypothetical protein
LDCFKERRCPEQSRRRWCSQCQRIKGLWHPRNPGRPQLQTLGCPLSRKIQRLQRLWDPRRVGSSCDIRPSRWNCGLYPRIRRRVECIWI